MSELSTNKIAGAALGTALVLSILAVVTPMLFEREPPAKPGYAITVAPEEGAAGAPAENLTPDWGTVLPTADVAAGEAKAAVCKACHMFDPAGANNIGPGLYGVVGRKPASHPGFAYSAAMQAVAAKQPIWDYQHLYEYLKSPQTYAPGTKMTYQGMSSAQDRINLIAYLHTLGSNLPIPPPAPKAAAPAAGKAPASLSGPPPEAPTPGASPAPAPVKAH
ncbi:MAG: cytochrome c family protein [Caulobacteraceae bacterium]|nr:cytochrome c family protein [Caulobacteraceae bacterium]